MLKYADVNCVGPDSLRFLPVLSVPNMNIQEYFKQYNQVQFVQWINSAGYNSNFLPSQ